MLFLCSYVCVISFERFDFTTAPTDTFKSWSKEWTVLDALFNGILVVESVRCVYALSFYF